MPQLCTAFYTGETFPLSLADVEDGAHLDTAAHGF